MKKLIIIFCLFTNANLFSQDETIATLKKEAERAVKKDLADTIPAVWKKGGLYNLNVAQSTLNNWAAGGDEFALAINSQLSLFAFHKKDNHSWDNTFDFILGYLKTTSLGTRKNDDRFDLLSKYEFGLSPKLNLAGLFNFRSQFFKGYNYDNDVKTLSSDFMAPGYLLLGLGIDYKPVPDLSIFFSPLQPGLYLYEIHFYRIKVLTV